MLCLIHDALDMNLAGTLEVCDGCARSKLNRMHSERRRTHELQIRGGRIFVEMTSPFPGFLM